MRTFVALSVPAEPRAALAAEILRLRRTWPGAGRWSRTENLHLTLAFIGELEREEAVRAANAVAEISAVSFDWRFSGLGRFGGLGFLWAGFADPAPVAALSQAVRMRLEDLGLPYDPKPFRPHVTLARDWRGPDADALGCRLTEMTFPAECAGAQLFVTERGPNGRIRYRAFPPAAAAR